MVKKKNEFSKLKTRPILTIASAVFFCMLVTLMLFGVTRPKSSVVLNASTTDKYFGVNLSGAEFGDTTLPGNLFTQYIYPSDINEFRYFSSKKLTLIRLPFKWERVQKNALGDLSGADIAGIRTSLDNAQQAGLKVILDLHNFGRYYNVPLVKTDTNKIADVWKKVASQFKDHPALFGYELMNEPHDMPESDSWPVLAQAATNAIREVDPNSWVLVPGDGWQNATFWPKNNANLLINDPKGKILYSAHLYFDQNYTGSYTNSYDGDKAYESIGVDRLKPFQTWLSQNNVKGIITEYGVPDNDSRWLTVLNKFLAALQNDDHIIGGTYWSAGPWWGNYPLSAEPRNSQDRPQMSILASYPSSASVTLLTPTPTQTQQTPTQPPIKQLSPTQTILTPTVVTSCQRCSITNGCAYARWTNKNNSCSPVDPLNPIAYETNCSCPQISGGNNSRCNACGVPQTTTSTLFAGEFYNNSNLSGTPTLLRNDQSVNFNWGKGAPDPMISSDRFSIRWKKTDNFSDGNYRFNITADDGFRLFIDGQLVLNKWIDESATTYTIDKSLSNGPHTIIMEYYENIGDAVARLSYSKL